MKKMKDLFHSAYCVSSSFRGRLLEEFGVNMCVFLLRVTTAGLTGPPSIPPCPSSSQERMTARSRSGG